MKELTTTWLISELSEIQSKKLEYTNLIMKLEIELEESDLVRRIMKWKQLLKELKEKEIETKNNGLKVLESANIEKFESNGVEIRRKVSIWRLVIEDESLIPEHYKEEVIKTTIKIDKKEIKDNLKQWEIIDWVKLEQDITLEVKYL